MGKNIEFQQIRVETPDRNSFDLSFDSKLTLDMGKLYPVMIQDTLPGDIFNITPEMLIRLSPMIAPVMHKIDARIHAYFVPNRLLWNDWDKFLSGKDVVKPYIQGTDSQVLEVLSSKLHDYIGLPLTSNMKEKIDAFPYMAMTQIYNYYYQDQNNDESYDGVVQLIEDLKTKSGRLTPMDLGAADNDRYLDDLAPCAYEHDLFTSALPFAQKGDAVNIPITLAALVGNASITNSELLLGGANANGDIQTQLGVIMDSDLDAIKLIGSVDIPATGSELEGTVNQLRTAMATQKFLELMARSGTRYHELIQATWGESIGDARINRPEYIGGIKNNVVISEVLQTSQSDDVTNQPLGQFAGHGTTYMEGNNISYKCVEHGWIICLMSILPRTAYFQGIPRKLSRQSYLDYALPQFAHIGEQAILNKEVYYDNADDLNNDEFGYDPRFSEYKCNNSEVHGLMRTSLLFWHLGRKFDNRPALNREFIYVQNDKRIFAVTEEDSDSYIAHIFFNVNAQRKLPLFSTPAGL